MVSDVAHRSRRAEMRCPTMVANTNATFVRQKIEVGGFAVTAQCGSFGDVDPGLDDGLCFLSKRSEQLRATPNGRTPTSKNQLIV